MFRCLPSECVEVGYYRELEVCERRLHHQNSLIESGNSKLSGINGTQRYKEK